ncbi:hypothetical protein HYDPIDRAFT_168366 [Hydnomerulius pinastri MD-312]|uniref:Rho-GAP domain-containing protein n=1 Tax=Hydnomerulius pinastri MD-312 TaxID=994086 RepID=A0A0C9WEP8_9AGAM|nr:hypothetical protein HYDPIDRAFT_168366 [Hydnomerulius pinastri MD-312]
MPLSPFTPRPSPSSSRQEDSGTAAHGNPRTPYASSSAHPHNSQSEAVRPPRSILRPPNPSQNHLQYDTAMQPYVPRPQLSHNSRTTAPSTSYQHHHTSSSPELRPRADSAWAPRARQFHDLAQTGYTSCPPNQPHMPRFARDSDSYPSKRNSLNPRILNQHGAGRGRFPSLPDVRMSRTPPADLDRDRLARACGQSAMLMSYSREDRSRREGDYPPAEGQWSRSRVRHQDSADAAMSGSSPTRPPEPTKPPTPRIKASQMYRRLDALARRYNHRAMDYLSFEDVVSMYKNDNSLREQLRRKRSDRMQEMDPGFHAIGAPLEDVLLYASTSIAIGDHQHDLPIVVVACVEELTKTGIYQNGLFRALPSRDRHLQLIDIFDKSADFGAQFSMRGQMMPDVCALLSTFISSLPGPLLDPHLYSALWQWSVKPSVKREDARREQQEWEEEERRAKGEPRRPSSTQPRDRDDLHLGTDDDLEGDQICIAQILLRLLPIGNLSLLIYLCGFFTQLPLCPENGIQFEDIARIFGQRLLGGSTKAVSQKMMVWLLTRWSQISDTLFGESCGMNPPSSPTQPPTSPAAAEDEESQRRPDQSEKRKVSGDSSSESPPNRMASSLSPDPTEDHDYSPRRSSSDGEDDDSGGSRRRKKRELNAEQSRSNGRRHSRKDKSGRQGTHGSRRTFTSERKSSSTDPQDPFSIDARDDLSNMPLLLSAPSTAAEASGLQPSDRLLVEAQVRISRLENELRRNDVVVVDAIQETLKANDEARLLSEKVGSLEKVLQDRETQARGTYAHDEDALKLQLRIVESERDKARRIMQEMRDLLDSRATHLAS